MAQLEDGLYDPGMTTSGRGRYAVIPTHDRYDELRALVAVMVDQVDMVYVVDNASTPPISGRALREEIGDSARGKVVVIYDSEQPPNLTRLWTVGLEQVTNTAALRGFTEWDIAILNDDAVVPPGWFALVADQMREHGAAAACSLPQFSSPFMQTQPDANLGARLYGPAFVLRGELAAREGDPLWPDISIQWWFQDTDTDWRARANGGMLIVPGPYVLNTHANETTNGPLGEQAGRDRETFRQKWGWVPW